MKLGIDSPETDGGLIEDYNSSFICSCYYSIVESDGYPEFMDVCDDDILGECSDYIFGDYRNKLIFDVDE